MAAAPCSVLLFASLTCLLERRVVVSPVVSLELRSRVINYQYLCLCTTTMLRTAFHVLASIVAYLVASVLRATTFCIAMLLRVFQALSRRGAAASQAASTAGAANLPSDVELLTLKGVLTEIMTLAPPTDTPTSPVLVMFPGNPGSVAFYRSYLSHAQQAMPTLRCVCVGHASHSAATASPVRYNLAQQVDHKLNAVHVLRARYPAAPLFLAGHSVGAYMVTEVMRHLPADAVRQAFLLFPTLMHIGSTANGRSLTPIFRHFRPAAAAFAHAVALLPPGAQREIIRPFVASTDPHSIDAALSLVHGDVAANALHLAHHEMNEIRDLDEEHYSRIAEKLLCYYAVVDGWVGASHPDEIRTRFPRAAVHVCTEGHRHAFVVDAASSKSMGLKTAGWIKHALGHAEGHAAKHGSASGAAAAAAASVASGGAVSGAGAVPAHVS